MLVLRSLARRSPKRTAAIDPRAERLPPTQDRSLDNLTPETPTHPWLQFRRLGRGDKTLLIAAASLVITLALSPVLTSHSASEVLQILATDLRPLP